MFVDTVRAFALDLAKRAAHTFWQTFAATLAVLWVSAGLDVADLVSLDAWHKIVTAVVSAAAAGLLSVVKTIAVSTRPDPYAEQQANEPAVDPDAIDGDDDVDYTPLPPGDPEQPAAGTEPAETAGGRHEADATAP